MNDPAPMQARREDVVTILNAPATMAMSNTLVHEAANIVEDGDLLHISASNGTFTYKVISHPDVRTVLAMFVEYRFDG